MEFPTADLKARIKPQASISLCINLQQGFLIYVKISMKAGEGGKIQGIELSFPFRVALFKKLKCFTPKSLIKQKLTEKKKTSLSYLGH